MELVSKKNEDGVVVPDWFSFFTVKEYSLFIEEVENYFKKLNIKYELDEGAIVLEEDEFGEYRFGLMNLAKVCKEDDLDCYPKIINDHFDTVTKITQNQRNFDKAAFNFEQIKKYLGVRLYSDNYVDFIGKDNIVGKNFAGNIYEVLIFDLPDSVRNVSNTHTASWNKEIDELLKLGIENSKRNYPINIMKQNFKEFSFWYIEEEHYFVPNVVFDIENRPELIGSKGSLVGLPSRHAAVIYPIESLEVLNVAYKLIQTIYRLNAEGPGSLSNNLLWYNDKTFTDLPYVVNDNKLKFDPPDSFLKMLTEFRINRL
jgi:hypothetical protein